MLGLAMTAQSRLVREFVELSIVDEEEREKHLLALLETADSHEYNLIAQLLMLEVALIYFERGQRTRAVREIDLCVSRAQENDIVAIFGWKACQVRSLLMVYLTTAKPSYKNRHFAQSLLRQGFIQPEEGEEDQLGQAVELTSKSAPSGPGFSVGFRTHSRASFSFGFCLSICPYCSLCFPTLQHLDERRDARFDLS